MSDLRKVIGAKEFRQRVKAKLLQLDENIKDEDIYFTQTFRGYYIEYNPIFPDWSDKYFIVHQDLNGLISVAGNEKAPISLEPSVFDDIDDFEERIETARISNGEDSPGVEEISELVKEGFSTVDNACVVGIGINDGENLNMTATFNGREYHIRMIMQLLLKGYLDRLDNEDDVIAECAMESLMQVIEDKKKERG